MRTAKEIRQYLKQQHWYKEYVRNARKYPEIFNRAISGYLKEITISGAFDWGYGRKLSVWCHREELFCAWYIRGKKIYKRKK